MSTINEITPEALETIGNYLRSNFRAWYEETVPAHVSERDIELRERIVRVEEELKSQRELMKIGFDNMKTGSVRSIDVSKT